ncbi:MAG: hypothetical protein L6Q71_00380 [Planctomycetes bacterium]|nr:hypothetical protein [Planctomycetota bacterium]
MRKMTNESMVSIVAGGAKFSAGTLNLTKAGPGIIEGSGTRGGATSFKNSGPDSGYWGPCDFVTGHSGPCGTNPIG